MLPHAKALSNVSAKLPTEQARYVGKSFFYGRDFASDADLNARALRWLDTVANVRVHGTLKERPADRFEAERPHLKPLAPWPYRPVPPRLPEPATQRSDEA